MRVLSLEQVFHQDVKTFVLVNCLTWGTGLEMLHGKLRGLPCGSALSFSTKQQVAKGLKFGKGLRAYMGFNAQFGFRDSG